LKAVGIVEAISFVFVEYDEFYWCFCLIKDLYLCFCWIQWYLLLL